MMASWWVERGTAATNPLHAETLAWWRTQRERIQARTHTLNTTQEKAA